MKSLHCYKLPIRPKILILLAFWVSSMFLIQGPDIVIAQTAFIKDIATDANDPLNRADSEPSIAVNPINPNEISIVAFSENWSSTSGAPVWKSFDGGLTWKKYFQIPQPAPGLSGPGDQKIAYDANGLLYVVELGLFPIQNFIYRQTGGPNAPLTVGVVYGGDQPHLSADIFPGSSFVNRLYSPWLDFGESPPRSRVSFTTTGGATMNHRFVYPPITFANRNTRIAIAPNGRVYVVYKTREIAPIGGFEGVHFRVNRSDDGGNTWNALGPNGVSVHGVGTVQTYFTNNFGNPAKGKVGRARSSDAWIGTDPVSCDIYVSYISKDASGFAQIYVARSTDEGANWSSTRATDGTHNSAYPEIAVADNGTVGVLYIDYDDSGDTTIFRHRFARSFDQGLTWADQILQSMNPTPMANASNGFLWGDYEGLTALGKTFYGVFTGASIGRTVSQLDPIFFKETAIKPRVFEYAAKIVCGTQKDSKNLRLARGLYATAINIHNPNDVEVRFFKKLALTFPPEDQRPGKVMPIGKDALRPDEALEVDCIDIKRKLFPNGFPSRYIKGFIVIQSSASLDVTAVYTTAKLGGFLSSTKVTSIDVEQIKERVKGEECLPDLIPVPNSFGSFCERRDNKLVVTVKNQGLCPSTASITEVDFFIYGTIPISTPPLGPGESVELLFDITPNCFDSDCEFRINVDNLNDVPETDEGNNSAGDTCIG